MKCSHIILFILQLSCWGFIKMNKVSISFAKYLTSEGKSILIYLSISSSYIFLCLLNVYWIQFGGQKLGEFIGEITFSKWDNISKWALKNDEAEKGQNRGEEGSSVLAKSGRKDSLWNVCKWWFNVRAWLEMKMKW